MERCYPTSFWIENFKKFFIKFDVDTDRMSLLSYLSPSHLESFDVKTPDVPCFDGGGGLDPSPGCVVPSVDRRRFFRVLFVPGSSQTL